MVNRSAFAKDGMRGNLKITHALFVSILLLVLGCAKVHHPAAEVTVSEAKLRSFATATVTPEFPDECLRRGREGVAVVRLILELNGAIKSVKTLDAPCERARASLETTVSRWIFRPEVPSGLTDGVVKGKLTFYYRIDAQGRGSVMTPTEAPMWAPSDWDWQQQLASRRSAVPIHDE